MSEYIFGIKNNGVSLAVTQLSIEDDQTMFDYICNVTLKSSNNGNGLYDVSITNKDYIQGMPVGKWRIAKAWIRYNWGDSEAKLIMEDKDGDETHEITADIQRGSVSGFHVPSLTRTIFTKAQEIIRDYPNTKICNAIIELNESKKHFGLSYMLKRYKEVLKESDENYIDYIRFVTDSISKHLKLYKTTAELLKNNKDLRSERLLKDITSDCRKLLQCFRVEEIP